MVLNLYFKKAYWHTLCIWEIFSSEIYKMLNGLHFRNQIAEFAMDICGFVILHCMFLM